VLTPAFYESYNPIPQAPVWSILASSLRAFMSVVGFEVRVVGELPTRPSLLCTNSTQRHDFFALMKALDERGQKVVTFGKAKNFHSGIQSFVMKRCGVLPLASRGYVLAADFASLMHRRPDNAEYRALRNHLDRAVELPEHLRTLQRVKRDVLGIEFDPSSTTYRDHIHRVYARSLAHSVRLAQQCVDAGFHVQIYPEGTVSRQLGVGRIGAVQFARALGLQIVPVGMSGCPEAFFGQSPVPAPGVVKIRVDKPLDLAAMLPAAHRPFHPEDEATHRSDLKSATQVLMDRIEALVDAPYKRPLGASLPEKGVRAFL
jgi:1-acyl-sn-glycerol-3-phosphate acyltransferase